MVPALFFIWFNAGQDSVVGWGIPMATDIAFALGVLAFVSRRVPLSLKILLLALATIDDLGAVFVIAGFYSSNISGFWISLSGLLVFLIFCFRQLRVRSYFMYLILGIGLWFVILKSGVHSTIAGVILGLMTPARPFWRKSDVSQAWNHWMSVEKVTAYSVEQMKKKLHGLQSPAQFLIDRLHRFVGFVVMPFFAFFNSGLSFKEGFQVLSFLLILYFRVFFWVCL